MFDRVVLKKIQPFLNTNDILLFYGSRQVGKTTLMKIIQEKYFKNNSIFFDLENLDYLDLLNSGPELFISYLKSYHAWDESNKITVFIDEVQYLSNPTNLLKYIYDHYKNIKLIVSGSSSFEIRGKLHDSLAGRLIKFEIYPLSFEEFLIFKDKENLSKLIGQNIDIELINKELKFYFEEYILFGSYPKLVLANDIDIKKAYLKQIYDTYIQKDIKDIGKIREVEKFNRLVKILANQTGNLLNISKLSRTLSVAINTINEWLFLLENTFVIKLIRPFHKNLRSELTKMPKLYFIDTGLRNIINNSFEITGSTFENSFLSYINHAYTAEKINFYRTQDKKEIDFIIDGNPYELKINYNGKKLSALEYFNTNYNKSGKVVSLNKISSKYYTQLYPWEV
ncbi:MAG: ATP-binding protein [Bacteroidales bacterium]|nr:ATP-binding protein [Bacteroidales bacterium]